jgi:hypothetical protein
MALWASPNSMRCALGEIMHKPHLFQPKQKLMFSSRLTPTEDGYQWKAAANSVRTRLFPAESVEYCTQNERYKNGAELPVMMHQTSHYSIWEKKFGSWKKKIAQISEYLHSVGIEVLTWIGWINLIGVIEFYLPAWLQRWRLQLHSSQPRNR